MTDNNMNERMTRVETKMENIELQVTNHIPTSIRELKASIMKKFDDVSKSNNLYLDNKVNSHEKDILDKKYACKEVENKVTVLESDKVKQGIFQWKYGIIWAGLGIVATVLLGKILNLI